MTKRKRKRTTLEEKIKKVLNDEALCQPKEKMDEPKESAESFADNEDNEQDGEESDDEEIMTMDNVREKNTTIKVHIKILFIFYLSAFIQRKKTEDDEFFEEWVRPTDEETEEAFADFHFDRKILKALGNVGWNAPTKIQQACVPVALAGRDICACATTGSGKTGAFVLPILHRFALIDSGSNSDR